MVQLFLALGEGEQAAFDAYADVYPDDTVLLIDTVDTLESGIPNAIATFERLRRSGHRPVGIRLDSGDLAYLAVQAARELDTAGFPEAVIVLSSQLDELTIWQIVAQIADEARRTGADPDSIIGRLVFGVGSRLASSAGDPSLDGVYKLVAVEDEGNWLPAMKRSDSPAKVLNPGRKRLWRVYDDRQRATADVLSTADEVLTPGRDLHLHHHARPDVSRTIAARHWSRADEVLVPVLDGRGLVYTGGADALVDLTAAAKRRDDDIEALDPGVRRLVRPHTYHVSITGELFELKRQLLTNLA
jgi:nicotinate phosphoribosyltransferase